MAHRCLLCGELQSSVDSFGQELTSERLENRADEFAMERVAQQLLQKVEGLQEERNKLMRERLDREAEERKRKARGYK